MDKIPNEKCCGRPERRFAGRAPLDLEREDCDAPKVLVCLNCGSRLVVRCGTSKSSRCSPCGESYRRRVMTVAGSGSHDAFLQGGSVLFVTLTAPGVEVHHLPNGQRCPCTPPGGVDLHTWNATSGHRWSRFVQQLRRETGAELQYFKGVEIQQRGAVHFHALFRIPEGKGSRRWVSTIRRIAVHHGFGHSVDAAPVADEKVAGYIAKYASKATDDREHIPWCDKNTGEMRYGEGRYRVWSSSRSWGLSMGQVRAMQQAFAVRMRDDGTGPGAGGVGPVAAKPPLDHKAFCSTSVPDPP